MKLTFQSLMLGMMLAALMAMPLAAGAQEPQVATVTSRGGKLEIRDFARAYCSPFDAGTPAREALAAFLRGSFKTDTTQCVVDTQNGYLKYYKTLDGVEEWMEMCYWNCDNKNEKLFAVNNVSTAMGFHESTLRFYRYNAKTGKMRLIDPPFDRVPQPLDMLDLNNADPREIEMVKNAGAEDRNRFMPCYSLPQSGKDITFKMATNDAINIHSTRVGKMQWNGSGFDMQLHRR